MKILFTADLHLLRATQERTLLKVREWITRHRPDAFVVGMLGRFGYLHLPEQLLVLQHTWVLTASGIMVLGEFLAD